MYVQRTLEPFIEKASSQFPVILLTGARQVGKTTLLRHQMGDDRRYASLDDPLIRNLAQEEPALFLQRFPPPVLIDEIQYAPQILPQIKTAVDRERRPGMFWLTGSQQFHIMKGVSESLAGRVGIVRLLGLSRQETAAKGHMHRPFLPVFEHLQERVRQRSPLYLKPLFEHIWRGAFPEISLNAHMDRDLFYGSYVQTYLQRDVRDLANVGNEMAFLRFLRAAAARTGQLLNLVDLARDADIAPNTAKTWLSVLQASGVIHLLEPYHSNVTKRMVKSPKLYFLDTGLCAYLTEWSSPETLEAGAMTGAILETWILVEILKSYWHNGRRAPFYYYRDKDKKEIDLLIVQDGAIYPLEFKRTASPSKEAVRHFSVLKRLNMPIAPGGLVCLCEEMIPLTDNTSAIPVGLL